MEIYRLHLSELKSISNSIYKIFNVRKNIRGSLLAFGLDSPFLLGTTSQLPGASSCYTSHITHYIYITHYTLHTSHIIYISHITHYTHHTLHSHSHHNSIADAWDRTRAACVGVQHATEWATRCPYNTSLFSIFIVNVHAHCMLHSQQFSFIFKILLRSINSNYKSFDVLFFRR